MKALSALAVVALIGACSEGGLTDGGRIGKIILDSAFPEDGPVAPPPDFTRAQLDEIPFATIALSIDDSPRAFVVPLADNGGYLTYMDATRRGFVMQGGAVVGTLGLGVDLNGVRNGRNDPVAYQTPLANWPGQIARSYQFKRRGGTEYQIALTCTFQRVASERIEIIERFFNVVRIAETCTNRARQVVNQYWVEPDTGFIWKSVQWVSPKQPQLTLEIVRPYSPG